MQLSTSPPLQRSQLSDLATAHGHSHGLTMLSAANQIACVLTELPQSCRCHRPLVAIVLPKREPCLVEMLVREERVSP